MSDLTIEDLERLMQIMFRLGCEPGISDGLAEAAARVFVEAELLCAEMTEAKLPRVDNSSDAVAELGRGAAGVRVRLRP